MVCLQTCPRSHHHTWEAAHLLKGCRHSPFRHLVMLAHHLEVCHSHHQVACPCHPEDLPEDRLADILLDHLDARSSPMYRQEFQPTLAMISMCLHLTVEDQREIERMKMIYPMCLRGVGEETSLVQLLQAQIPCYRQDSSGHSYKHARLAVVTKTHES